MPAGWWHDVLTMAPSASKVLSMFQRVRVIRVGIAMALLARRGRRGGGPDARSPVKTDAGPVTGVVAGDVAAYKGIPFAAPPVGDLRWKAPQPVKPWTAALAADHYAADCMQKPFGGDAAPLGTPPAEDCLYLNVWTPAARAAAPLPVMVWIYGGGFVNGGSSPAVYDGSAFARRGIVFVSMNYRLGRFGFFAHPALTAETPKGTPLGNYGFLDQFAALQWVKRNAAAFGGDPANVTIFGESAGGGSVNALMISPMAKGLFHKAIVAVGRRPRAGRSRCGTSASPAPADCRPPKRWAWPSRPRRASRPREPRR